MTQFVCRVCMRIYNYHESQGDRGCPWCKKKSLKQRLGTGKE